MSRWAWVLLGLLSACTKGGDTACADAVWFTDADGDGFGDPNGELVACEAPDGAVAQADDCADDDPDVYPGAPEVAGDGVDQDCSGEDGVQCYADDDGDGFGGGAASVADGDCPEGEVAADGDCDDADPASYPGADELPDDGVDQDCTGADAVSCYEDLDEDGYGGAVVEVVEGDCPSGTLALGGDCDEVDPAIHPGAEEIAEDGVDQDCSGVDAVWCYVDGDGDGYGGAPVSATEADCPVGESLADGDCDDGEAAVYPGAAEVADDGVDQDCSGADAVSCYPDSDGDGYGVGKLTLGDGACASGYASLDGDCDDAVATTNPGAVERCDGGVDNDCDPSTEDAGARIGGVTYASLQAAVSAATLGATVEICEGVYNETFNLLNKTITVTALSGPGTVVLDGAGLDTSVVRIQGGSPTLVGLTITGGRGTDYGPTRLGGGIYADTGGTVTLTDCLITANEADAGGGISMWDLDYDDTASLVLQRTEVSNNLATDGGGLYVLEDLTLSSSTIEANTAWEHGGGLLFGGSLYMPRMLGVGSSVVGNTADEGGGVWLWERGRILFDLEIRANTAVYGGGVFASGELDAPWVVDAVIEGNDAELGGGVYLFGAGTLRDALVIDGAADQGGGLYVDGELDVSGGALWRNSAVSGGGAWVGAEASLALDAVDVGVGADANTPQDVLHDGASFDWDGVVSATCAAGVCNVE
jgi:hypothetical protein